MSRAVREALRKRYEPPAWALLEEVRDATGYDAKRSADAIAMSLWPSRGLELHGFEIKSSRNDWVREHKSPDKAEAIAAYCDRWWLVVSDVDFVRDGELPATWGLLALGPKGLKTVREAPQRKPKTMDRPFLASLLRRAHDQMKTMVPREEVNDIVEARVKKREEEEARRRAQLAPNDPRALLEAVEEALGVPVRSLYDIPNIKLAYELVTQSDRRDFWIDGLRQSSKFAADAAKHLSDLYERGAALRGERKIG